MFFTAVLVAAVVLGAASHPSAQALEAGWTVGDIGHPSVPGSATLGADTVSVTSAGADVNGAADQFTFVYRPIRGNATLIARLAALGNADPWSQAGLMIRGTLDPGAKHGYVFGTSGRMVGFKSRTATRGTTNQAPAGQGGAPVWLKLERRAGVLTASRSADGTHWVAVGSAAVTLPEQVFVGLAVASHAAASVTATFQNVSFVGRGTHEAGFSAADVGTPLVSGGSWSNDGVFPLHGAGSGVGGVSDQFHYVYRKVSGDQEIVARVAAFETGAPTARAGIAFRQTLTGGAVNSSLLVSRLGEILFSGRRIKGTATSVSDRAIAAAPVWLKLSRRGGTVTALSSPDGVAWTVVGEQAVSLTNPFYVGLAVTSADPGVLARVSFDGVAVVSNQPPTVTLTSPSVDDGPLVLAAPASLVLGATASDVDGSVVGVDFYDGTTLIGSDTTSPYELAWNNIAAGIYALRAVARDNIGAATSSVTRLLSVVENLAPTVSLVSPVNGAAYTAPASISFSATASDPDGTVSEVEFRAGTTLVGSDTTPPYSFTWRDVMAGTYLVTALARDNLGNITVSGARTVTVVSGGTPSTAIFEPSLLGELVERYVLEVFPAGSDPESASPVAVQDLGLPSIVGGECSADVRATILALAPGSYIATVSAVSPSEGTFRSAPSPPFIR